MYDLLKELWKTKTKKIKNKKKLKFIYDAQGKLCQGAINEQNSSENYTYPILFIELCTIFQHFTEQAFFPIMKTCRFSLRSPRSLQHENCHPLECVRCEKQKAINIVHRYFQRSFIVECVFHKNIS